MSTNPPIGHLPDEHNHQACRDAAAGPPEPCSPGTEKWPGPLKPSTKYRGGGGTHPGGIRFHCDCLDCHTIVDSITELIHHTVLIHRRPPHDGERIPVT